MTQQQQGCLVPVQGLTDFQANNKKKYSVEKHISPVNIWAGISQCQLSNDTIRLKLYYHIGRPLLTKDLYLWSFY